MTLKDLTDKQLDSLEALVKDEGVQQLIGSRMEEIISREWEKKIFSKEAMVDLAYGKGVYDGWKSILNLEGQIEEERKIRLEEREKLEKGKNK